MIKDLMNNVYDIETNSWYNSDVEEILKSDHEKKQEQVLTSLISSVQQLQKHELELIGQLKMMQKDISKMVKIITAIEKDVRNI